MHTIDKKVLSDMVADAKPAGRQYLPILSHVRLTADGRELTVTGTDLDFYATRTAPFGGTFDVVVPAKALADAIKAQPAGEVTVGVETEEFQVTLVVGGSRLRCGLLEDWPALPEPTFSYVGTVPTWKLRKLLQSASTDQARPLLCSINVSEADGTVDIVSTDSYRLTRVTGELDAETWHAIIGGSTAKERAQGVTFNAIPMRQKQARWLSSSKKAMVEDVYVSVGTHQGRRYLSLERPDRAGRIAFREAEGTFPQWRSLIPELTVTPFYIDPAEMADILKGAMSLAEDHIPVRLRDDGTTYVTRTDVGEWSAVVPGLPNTGTGELIAAYNPKYLADTVAGIPEGKLEVSIIDGLKPSWWKVSNADVAILLMPVRI